MPPSSRPATLYWMRRDLRLGDNPALQAALSGDGPVIPVFILDPETESAGGAAPKWRLERSLEDLARRLSARGSRLVLRRGPALDVLRTLVAETGARRVVWSRQYDSAARARDAEVKAALRADGLEAESVNASLLFEPWTVETGAGGFYKVYTPFWRAVRDSQVAAPLPEPGDLKAPETWPASGSLADWGLGRAMNRGGDIVARFAIVGEEAARGRLDWFVGEALPRYKAERDRMDIDATSRLSQNLATGEIAPRRVPEGARRGRRSTGRARGPRASSRRSSGANSPITSSITPPGSRPGTGAPNGMPSPGPGTAMRPSAGAAG